MKFPVVSIIRTSELGELSLEEVFDAAQKFPALKLDYERGEIVIDRIGGLKSCLIWNEQLKELSSFEMESDIIALMIQLADELKARVRDEFLRTFRSPTEAYEHPEDAALIQNLRDQASRQNKSMRWRNLLAKLITPLVIALVLFLLNYHALWPQPEIFSAPTDAESQSSIANAHLGEKAEVIFVPLGNFSNQFLAQLAVQTNRMTGLQVRVANPRPIPIISSYREKDQVDAIKIVESQVKDIDFLRRRYGNGTLIYFTSLDINQGISPLSRFVFSHQDYRNRICVISGHRLTSGTGISHVPKNIVRERVLKLTLRAIGELNLGLEKNDNKNSIMNSPIRGVMDVDDLKYAPFESE